MKYVGISQWKLVSFGGEQMNELMVMVGTRPEIIKMARKSPYSDGNEALRIVEILENELSL
jgi:UDP-N-acetylglucosamine 2-epimerase